MLNKKQLDREFGRRLRKIAKERGITLKELEVSSGLSHNSLWKYLSYGGNPQMWSVYRLAKALGVTMDELVGGLYE